MLEKLKQNLSIVALLFGIVAVAMIFCPAVGISFSTRELENFFEYEYEVEIAKDMEHLIALSGKEAVFGLEVCDEEIFEFSFMGLVTFALPALGCAFLYYADLKQNKGYANFALVCFLVGAICMFCLPNFLQVANGEINEGVEEIMNFKLGVGAIIGGISCAISALCTFQCRNEYN